MNDEYIPKPSMNATVLVVHTPRMRIIRMSTSGSVLLRSRATHEKSTTTPTPNSPSVRGESQPQPDAFVTASSTAVSPADISAAEPQLTRPGTRTGDSGTKRWISTVAAATGISGIQNSQWNE